MQNLDFFFKDMKVVGELFEKRKGPVGVEKGNQKG
jgi:hypothetical protein